MLGDVIREYRMKLGYSRDAFARLLGVSGPAVTKWEHNEANPSAQSFANIAQALGLSGDELYRLATLETITTRSPSHAEIADKVYLTNALIDFGIILQDGTIDLEQLRLATQMFKLLKAFCRQAKKVNQKLFDYEESDEKTSHPSPP
jgi:transcriptional regulator with XRE-family HTH domain